MRLEMAKKKKMRRRKILLKKMKILMMRRMKITQAWKLKKRFAFLVSINNIFKLHKNFTYNFAQYMIS